MKRIGPGEAKQSDCLPKKVKLSPPSLSLIKTIKEGPSHLNSLWPFLTPYDLLHLSQITPSFRSYITTTPIVWKLVGQEWFRVSKSVNVTESVSLDACDIPLISNPLIVYGCGDVYSSSVPGATTPLSDNSDFDAMPCPRCAKGEHSTEEYRDRVLLQLKVMALNSKVTATKEILEGLSDESDREQNYENHLYHVGEAFGIFRLFDEQKRCDGKIDTVAGKYVDNWWETRLKGNEDDGECFDFTFSRDVDFVESFRYRAGDSNPHECIQPLQDLFSTILSDTNDLSQTGSNNDNFDTVTEDKVVQGSVNGDYNCDINFDVVWTYNTKSNSLLGVSGVHMY